MKQLVSKLVAYMLDNYVTVLLIIAGISTVTYLTLYYDLRSQEGSSAIIKFSAGQSQRIQEIAYLSVKMAAARDEKTLKNMRRNMIDHITLFGDIHSYLRNGDRVVQTGSRVTKLPGVLSDELVEIYFGPPAAIDKRVSEYMRNARAVMKLPLTKLTFDNPNLAYMHSAALRNLQKYLGKAVAIYQKDSEYRLRRSRNLQSLLYMLTLFSLALVGGFILKPLVGKLKDSNNNLTHALDELGLLSTRMQDEINLAAMVQRNILPASNIELPGLHGQAKLLTSSEVGGDYYDYYSVDGYKTILLVGDVSGHGVAAGTLVSAAKAGTQPLMNQGISQPSEILSTLNDTIFNTAHQSLLMSMTCLSLDARTGKLVFTNAGHVLPFLWQQQKRQWRMLESGGLPLGKSLDADYTSSEVELYLEVGDRLFLYTDGLVEEESATGEPFGYDRLESVLKQYGKTEPEVLHSQMMAALRHHCGSNVFSDDVTLVVVDHTERVIAAATNTETSDIIRVAEAQYRVQDYHPTRRISRQYLVFFADGNYADLLFRFCKDGIRRVLNKNDGIYTQLDWERVLNQHTKTLEDDLYALTPQPLSQQQYLLTHTDEKLFIMQEIEAWLEDQAIVSPDHVNSLLVLLDELIENSFYAAPRDGQDNPFYRKGETRQLDENEQVRIDLTLTEGMLGLMVTDNWGTLVPATFLKYLANAMDQGIQAGVGGGGLYMTWRLSDYLQVRVYPHQRTQFTVLWDCSREPNVELNSGFQFLFHNEHDEVVVQ